MFTFIGNVYLCVRCNRYRNLFARNIEMYLFCLGKRAQFNEMHHAMERMQTDIYLWISLICLRKRSTFYRIDRKHIYVRVQTRLIFPSNKIILQFELLQINWKNFLLLLSKICFGHWRTIKNRTRREGEKRRRFIERMARRRARMEILRVCWCARNYAPG